MLRGAVYALLLSSAPVWANAPETSPLPQRRPVVEEPAQATVRPRPRPQFTQLAAAVAMPQSSPRPERRGTAAVFVPPPPVVAPRRGQLCGVAGIEGEPIAAITSRTNGCGVADAVRVRAVSGVRLSQAATVDCSIAQALNTWVDNVLQPAFDGQVRTLQIAGSYTCRGRNNQRGAKISEHGKGRAVDISGLTFRDGETITVERDWNRGQRGRAMVAAYRGGCGIFGTTLGPGSDGYHEDHMHFDTPSNRRSPYCR